ncbi:MAG: hypothetical protein AAFQ90_09535 [Pseudomonadota bacterium]
MMKRNRMILMSVFLGGCAAAPKAPDLKKPMPLVPAGVAIMRKGNCPPIPRYIRRAAKAKFVLPADIQGRDKLTGDAMVIDARKTQALEALSSLYDLCRKSSR